MYHLFFGKGGSAMTNLTNRSTEFNQPVPLREAINSLFSQSFLSPTWGTLFGHAATPGPALDVYEDEDNYFVLAVMPGVDPNKLEITSQDNTLSIAGEIGSFVPEGKHVVWQELPVGSFRRVLTLPMPFDTAKVQAQYDGGLLKLIVPKAEHARLHRIPISANTANTPPSKI
jgi:HSP20 family protein